MKTLLLALVFIAAAVGYNYALAEHGPEIYRAINGPEPVKAAKPTPHRLAR